MKNSFYLKTFIPNGTILHLAKIFPSIRAFSLIRSARILADFPVRKISQTIVHGSHHCSCSLLVIRSFPRFPEKPQQSSRKKKKGILVPILRLIKNLTQKFLFEIFPLVILSLEFFLHIRFWSLFKE
jgi:hypothetical protein